MLGLEMSFKNAVQQIHLLFFFGPVENSGLRKLIPGFPTLIIHENEPELL